MPASDEARSPATRSEQPGGLRITRLVVGYDGSAGAGAAAAFALWLAGRTGCEATVFHAGPTPETVPSADLLPSTAEQVVAYERESQWRLGNLREDAGEDGVVRCRVLRGNPAGVLIAAAVDSGADLILTGSRGAGRIRGALLGSVSSQVLTHAPCSVMVSPPTPNDPRRRRMPARSWSGSTARRRRAMRSCSRGRWRFRSGRRWCAFTPMTRTSRSRS